MMECDIAIIGGGASGFFTAGNLRFPSSEFKCRLFEGNSRALTKVRISGGGRCNVTHHQFDVAKLVENYPRGYRELRGPFSRFQPKDMIDWLSRRGVETKTEQDGRMFPISDDSNDIIRCLEKSAREAGVMVHLGFRLSRIEFDPEKYKFTLSFLNGEQCSCRYLVMATGGHESGFELLSALGHTIVPPTPSLFTFNITDQRITGLAGVSFSQVEVSFGSGKKRTFQRGPLLVTHWGLSGPSILKLSAWASKELADASYIGELNVDFAPDTTIQQLVSMFQDFRTTLGSRQTENLPVEFFPKRYWQQVVQVHELSGKKSAQLNKHQVDLLIAEIKSATFHFGGKSTHKDEFVTAGGVNIREIDMKTMQSKLISGLYVTGELLNIDGITGGFNFQNAWTSGYLCATDLNEQLSRHLV